MLVYRTVTWHPFFQSAAHGNGFPIGVGCMYHVSPYNYVDVRGSYSVTGYKRAEAEFLAPRLFDRRGQLSVIGGWGEATQVGFYGVGPNTSIANRAYYGFKDGYGSALLTVWPTRRLLMVRGGVELSQWSPERAGGGLTSVEQLYTPATLPGIAETTTYLHTQATIGFDWRPAPGYARRGGFYAITAHDYSDRDNRFGFREIDYELVQHFPILREAWVISLRGAAQATLRKDGQDVPYYLLPHLGGGSSLRGFDSWRFRDRNRLLLQAECYHGESLHGHGGLLRRRQSNGPHRGYRLQRPEERLRLRRALRHALPDGTPHRSREKPRNDAAGCFDERRLLRLIQCVRNQSLCCH